MAAAGWLPLDGCRWVAAAEWLPLSTVLSLSLSLPQCHAAWEASSLADLPYGRVSHAFAPCELLLQVEPLPAPSACCRTPAPLSPPPALPAKPPRSLPAVSAVQHLGPLSTLAATLAASQPLLTTLSIALSFTTVAYVFLAVPLLDLILGKDLRNPSREEAVRVAHSQLYRALPRIYVPLHFATLLCAMHAACAVQTHPLAALGEFATWEGLALAGAHFLGYLLTCHCALHLCAACSLRFGVEGRFGSGSGCQGLGIVALFSGNFLLALLRNGPSAAQGRELPPAAAHTAFAAADQHTGHCRP